MTELVRGMADALERLGPAEPPEESEAAPNDEANDGAAPSAAAKAKRASSAEKL